MTHTISEVEQWFGQKVVGGDGSSIGTIKDVYLDDATNQPEWLVVSTGALGGVSVVPIVEAHRQGDEVHVPYGKDLVKSAPYSNADGEISQEEERRLYDHYGLVYSEHRSSSGWAQYDEDVQPDPEPVMPVVPPPPPPPPPAAATAVEEREVVLYEEVPVVEKRVVPRERVRLGKDTVTEQVDVTGEVRREQIEVEGVEHAGRN